MLACGKSSDLTRTSHGVLHAGSCSGVASKSADGEGDGASWLRGDVKAPKGDNVWYSRGRGYSCGTAFD